MTDDIIPALIVNQWLPEWNNVEFCPAPPRGKPEQHFYIFSISASLLKKLTGIYRRDPEKAPAEDMGIQRRHIPERSAEILRYIQDGFPLSRIDRKRLVNKSEVNSLRMPGWLPTAVVVNILSSTDKRGYKDKTVEPDELISVKCIEGSSIAEITLPDKSKSDEWAPLIHPIEVIDGQHRLWALDDIEEGCMKDEIDSIQIPVVAFYGLDRTWQAYLFYTINQLAKRIDISMVFDLYPLLRTEDWLLRFEGPNIYRETRAQDLTILLWEHQDSPWKDRIIRLGGREKGKVAQAAFIRSLAASFIKRYDGGNRIRIGGIYGARSGEHETYLNWGREQQAAFLIIAWQELRNAVQSSKASWSKALIERNPPKSDTKTELFSGTDTLLASDQGVRGFLCVLNDLLWVAHDQQIISLKGWDWDRKSNMEDQAAITSAVQSFHNQFDTVVDFIRSICICLADFDWRMSSAVPQNDSQYLRQASYKGSGGYKEIRRAMLIHLLQYGAPLNQLATEVIEALRYENEEEA